MKKTSIIMASVATLALALSLVGCGGNKQADTAKSDAAQTESTSSQSSDSSSSSSSTSTSDSAQAGQASIRIDTDGMGVISWSYENEEPEFDEDTPYQSAVVNDAYGQTIHVEARDYDEYEGWHFVKWTKDGEDYSTDNRIDVYVDSDAQLVAVFEFAEE